MSITSKSKNIYRYFVGHLCKYPLKNIPNNRSFLEKNFSHALRVYKKKSIKGIDHISHTLNALNIDKEFLGKDYLSQLLGLAFCNSSLTLPSETDAEAFLNATIQLKHHNISPDKLLLLSYILVNYGLFRAGYVMREKAIESALLGASENTNDKTLMFRALSAAFDDNNLEESRRILNELSHLCTEEELRDYEFFGRMINSGAPCTLKPPFYNFKEEDYAYYSLVEGCSVAVVGPAHSEVNNNDDINSHDLIIRMNYYGNNIVIDKRERARTDISYYNKQLPQIIDAQGNDDFLHDLKFLIFKTIEHPSQKKLLTTKKGRLSFKMNNLLFNGNANIFQNALFDLLCFAPKKISVYNVTFFLSQIAYQRGYQQEKYKQRPPNWRWHSFAGHDLITQINYTRNLWQAGRIEVDTPCKRVLELDNYTYMKKMEKIWVTSPIANSDPR